MAKNEMLKMNLQLFAESQQEQSGDNGGSQGGNSQTGQGGAGGGQGAQIDYDRIAQILEGKQRTTEDSVLRGYFKQQGLSKEEMEQAISAFKKQKAESQPDVAALQSELKAAQELAQNTALEKAATLAAVGLGLDAKTIPYVLKMADLSTAVDADGKINSDNMQKAIQKVLDDVPALKPQAGGNSGFRLGAGNEGQKGTTTEDALKAAFGV